MATIDEAQILAEDKFEYFKDICNVYKAIENCEDIEEIKKKVTDLFGKFERFRQNLKSISAIDRKMNDLNAQLDNYHHMVEQRRKVLRDALEIFHSFSTDEA